MMSNSCYVKAENDVTVRNRHSGSAWIMAAMAVSSSLTLPGHDGRQFIERGQHGSIHDEPLLVQLRGADFSELTQARNQGAQVLLGGGGQR